MADTFDTNEQQSVASEGSLVLGKIRQSSGLWPAIEGLQQADPVRNGVLIIFGGHSRGRIGIFCNRYITGALDETSGTTGLDAILELLAVNSGMFGFRACMGEEPSELAHDFAIDLDDVLLLRGDHPYPREAAFAITTETQGKRIRDTKKMAPIVPDAQGQIISTVPQIEKSKAEDSFSYGEWLDEEKAKKTGELPKFRQVLMNAAPADEEMRQAIKGGRPEDDVLLYGRLLESEKAKIVKDIEISRQKQTGDQTEPAAQATQARLNELQLASEFIQAEQTRAQKWAGLDEIMTPRTVATGQVNKGNLPRTAEEAKDLLAANRPTGSLPRDFIKRNSDEDMRAPSKWSMEWLRHPYFIGGASIVIIASVAGAISNMQSRAQFEESLSQAKSNLKLGHANDAVFVLNKAIDSDNGNARAFFYRGLAYSAMNDYEHASKDFEQSINLGGPRNRSLVARASAAEKAGKFDDAIRDCTDVLKNDPKNLEALMIRATAFERSNNYTLSLQDAAAALALTKDVDNRAHLLLQRGVAYTRDGKINEAEKDFGEAINIKPDAPTYMQRGDAYRSLKKPEEAAADYTQVIALDPRNYDAYVARGIALHELHKDAAAMKDFARALSLTKTGVEAMIQRGSLFLQNGHYRLAANDLEDAMTLAPHDAEAQQKLAAAYTHLHRTFPKSWLHLPEVAQSSSAAAGHASTPTAIATNSKDSTTGGAIKMPEDAKSLLEVGYKYLAQGQVDFAIQMFTQAVRKEPNNADARRYLAHAMAQAGNNSGAISQFNALVDLNQLTPRDALTYSKALTSGGDLRRAADVLAQCVQSRPRDITMRSELMRVYNSLGQAAKAQNNYEQGIRFARNATDKAELDAALHGRVGSGGSSTPTGDGSQLGG